MRARKPHAVTWVGWNHDGRGTATHPGDSSGMSLINLSTKPAAGALQCPPIPWGCDRICPRRAARIRVVIILAARQTLAAVNRGVFSLYHADFNSLAVK